MATHLFAFQNIAHPSPESPVRLCNICTGNSNILYTLPHYILEKPKYIDKEIAVEN